MDAQSIWGLAIEQPPANIFAADPMPGGETADGLALSINPQTGKLQFLQPHIDSGPSSLTVNRQMASNQDNFLWGSINYATFGFRTDLVAYIPEGMWNLYGQLTVAGPTNMQYDIKVWKGTAFSQDAGRPHIMSESPVVCGGGSGTWPGAAQLPFSMPFSAHQIYFPGQSGEACEISISCCPRTYAGTGSGVASAIAGLASLSNGAGGVPNCFLSSFMIWRARKNT